MIAYGVGILPVINNLKREIPDARHPWCADNSGALGTFARIETYFDPLTLQGQGRGYYPEPYKSVLIVRLENIEAGTYLRALHGFKVCTGASCLGGYIRYNESKRNEMRERMLKWEKNVNTISKTVGKYPQESYAAVVCAIQSEWILLQRVSTRLREWRKLSGETFYLVFFSER